MGVDWRYYDKFKRVMDRFLPDRGEGESKATQIVTSVNKLVYKWYNDGDVFDNTYSIDGWCNDLSSYANWLEANAYGARGILCKIRRCSSYDDYEQLLKELADKLLDMEDLENAALIPAIGSIYECDGPYRFEEPHDEYDECQDMDFDDEFGDDEE